MDKKEKILSKLNIKDYNNRLEKILEKKKFSLDTKNLLLGMLYRIENGYADYKKTKVEVLSKNEFIENIFNIIMSNCNEINVAEFDSQASKILKEKNEKYIIEKDNGKITVLGNELLLFDCILKIAQKQVCVPEELEDFKVPISNFLNLGDLINKSEVMRDFNGWSWNPILKNIQDIKINVIFQTLIYLAGNEFVNKWISSTSELADYLELLQFYIKENFGEKRASEFLSLFCKLVIDISISQDKDQMAFWKEKRKYFDTELDILQDKQKFLKEITEEKKKYGKQIENIDKIMNNKELLKEEYISRNEKLPNKEKIFSISHLVGRLEKEREELLTKIKECNNLIEPKGYVERKKKVEEKVEFLNSLDIEQKEDIKKTIIDLCEIFLECFQIKIAKAKTKQEIVDYIYELRYYVLLALDSEGTKIKEVVKLRPIIEKNKVNLLKKAKQLYAIDEVTDDEKANEEILENIFDSKMIDLDHMVIQTRVTEGKLCIEYYDENILENTIQLQSDRTLKLKKKTKLFI